MKNCLKYYFLLGLFLQNYSLLAQNLVPNPSFENMKKFPSCKVSLPKDTFATYVYDWFMPTNGTPDIFSNLVDPTCIASSHSTHPTLDVFPVASHEPRTGDNFAGLVINDWYREYLSVKLSQPLVPGQVYCCEMYVAFNSSALIANDGVAMYFSVDEPYGEDDFLVFTPQISQRSIISDTNWVQIRGNFKATSAAEYLTIGGFKPVGGFSSIAVGSNSIGKYPGNYIYLDDISVIKVDLIDPVITGNKLICPGDTLKMRADGWDNITWNLLNNPTFLSTTNEIEIITNTKDTLYEVRGRLCGWPMSFTVPIKFHDIPVFSLGNDTLICEGSTLTLNPGPGLFDFQWQDGSTNNTLNISLEGEYKLSAANSYGCRGKDSILIGYYLAPDFSLGEDLEKCEPNGLLNANTGHPYDTYLWSNLSTTPISGYSSEGTYWVTATNPCGVAKSDTISIYRVELILPNLITINNDNLNDELVIQGAIEGNGSLSVYNRFGSRVYSDESYKNDWSADDLSLGLYYYEFTYPSCEPKRSWLQLIK